VCVCVVCVFLCLVWLECVECLVYLCLCDCVNYVLCFLCVSLSVVYDVHVCMDVDFVCVSVWV